MRITKKIIMPRKDATYYNRIGGQYKLIKHIDKNFSVCELPLKEADYLIRVGGKYRAYEEVSEQKTISEEII